MFSEYRSSDSQPSENGYDDHENAFIQFSNYTRSSRGRHRIKKKQYVGIFDDILLSIKLESLYLEESTPPMKRYSSPSRDYCFHCAHDHNQSCCLYFYDTESDKIMYSKWKSELETKEPYYIRNSVPKIPEALAGNTTPRHFPGFTYNNPEFIETRIGLYTNQNMNMANGENKRWFQQFYYPLIAMDIIPRISGTRIIKPTKPASFLRSPSEIRSLTTLPPPPIHIQQSWETETPKMCCNAHALVMRDKTTNDHQNHYYNNNRYYHYHDHHHHYNNYNNHDDQQYKFIPTTYFYNKQTPAYQANKRKKNNYKPETKKKVPASQLPYHHNHNIQKNHRYYKNKKCYNYCYQKQRNYREFNHSMANISTSIMYFY